MQSIWKINTKNYPQLTKNISADVCVVGGGISGFLTAFTLAEKGFDVTLLEANKLFSGTTVNTTAFLSALQGVVYSEMEKKHGTEFSNNYFNSKL